MTAIRSKYSKRTDNLASPSNLSELSMYLADLSTEVSPVNFGGIGGRIEAKGEVSALGGCPVPVNLHL